MKRFTEFINEKLKVSKNSGITLEALLKVLKDYKDRKYYEISVYIDLKKIFEEYPVVLQYHGHYIEDIKGKEIIAIQFIQYNTKFRKVMEAGKDVVFIYFNNRGDSIQIENTEELNDVFGENVLDKIYDYIITR